MNITARANKWIADSGDDTDELRDAATIIGLLLNEVERLDKSLKLVQGHAKRAMDSLPAKWNDGFAAGLKSAGYSAEESMKAIKQEREERNADNSQFTEEIMRLESDNAALKLQLSEAEGWIESLHDELDLQCQCRDAYRQERDNLKLQLSNILLTNYKDRR